MASTTAHIVPRCMPNEAETTQGLAVLVHDLLLSREAMKFTGRVYQRPKSQFWWIQYSHNGTVHRESSKSTNREDAERLLRLRVQELGADRLGLKKFIGPASERIKINELLDTLDSDMQLRSLRSLKATQSHLKQTRAAFGHYRVKEITSTLIDKWIQRELAKENAWASSTINRRLAVLQRAFRVAKEQGMLAEVPKIRKLSELGRVRQGFFEKADFDALVAKLPDHVKDFARFAYLTGWRKGEISSLKWSDVDMAGRVIRLRPENSKNAQGRTLALEGQLLSIIELQYADRIVDGKMMEYVFNYDGQRLRSFSKSWRRACKEANIGPRLFHDLRRTAVRNMVRAGIPEVHAMATSGHKTRAIFDRYNIVSEDDLRAAQKKLQQHLSQEPDSRKVVSIQTAQGA